MTSFSGKLFPRGSRGNPNVICVFLLPSPSCFFTFRPCSAGFASQARRFFYKKRIRRKLACRRIRFIVIRPKMRTKKTCHARLRSPNFGRLAKAAHDSEARRFLYYQSLPLLSDTVSSTKSSQMALQAIWDDCFSGFCPCIGTRITLGNLFLQVFAFGIISVLSEEQLPCISLRRLNRFVIFFRVFSCLGLFCPNPLLFRASLLITQSSHSAVFAF